MAKFDIPIASAAISRETGVMAARNVSLSAELDRWIGELVSSGEYENASEVVRAALRALREHRELHQARLAAIRAGLEHGERSGIAEGDPFERVRHELGLGAE
jgi:antitoxin ParD1/3/4